MVHRLLPLVLLSACALVDEDYDADGWSAADGDCDDYDPAVYPDAEDAPGDGLDQNCDGANGIKLVEGASHSCELTDRGQVVCTGSNEVGQLDVPVVTERVIDLAAGDYHTCALEESGTIVCWGDDTWGQASPPVVAPYSAIDAGGYWSVGVLEPRERAVCWGRCLGH